MLRITAIPYTLQFKRPAMTSRGALQARPVIFLRAERDGVVGWGECGPVAGLSPDDRPDFGDLVRAVCDRINGGVPPERIDSTRLPSLAFGLETALRDLATGGRQRLVDTPFSRGETSLPTHGLIWMDTPDAMLAQIEAKLAAGCRVIKMKVGALPVEVELALLAEFRRRWPPDYVELRLDANGVWQTVDEALVRLYALARFAPAFLEQPLPAGRWRDTAEVCSRSPVPIALDEELIGTGNPAALLDAIHPQHVVVKPTLLGGLAACETWINAAEAYGVQWWINSLLESNVGLNAIAQWTAARGEGRVHGLGTGRLFANNIPAPLRLHGCGLQMERGGAWDFGVLWSGDEARSASSSRALAIDDHTFTRDDLLHLDLADLPPHFSDNERAALAFCRDWLHGIDEVVATTSGSTGLPKSITLTRAQMAASAHATGEALGLRAGTRALVCLPVRYIAGQMMLVRGLALGMSMTLVEPCSDPLASLPAGQRIDFAALVPLQLQAMLDGPVDRRARLDAMHAILVGGAPVSAALEDRIRTLAAPVYHTYGMTETATHIALRRLNGREASPYFQPLPGVQIEVDDRGCLRVKGPMTLDRWVQTNDLVELSSLHPPPSTLHPLSFRWLGRWDNVINSGGIKVAVEVVERAVENAWQACGLAPRRFFVAGTPDERLGDAVTLVVEGDPLSSAAEECLVAAAAERVHRFERPRGVIYLPAFAETATGKIDRAASLRRVANFSEKLATLATVTDHA